MLRIERHLNKIFSSVTYAIFDDCQKFCWIIDAGDYDDICKLINGYELMGIFLTHIHYDHIYGLNDLQEVYPQVPIYTNYFGKKSLTSPEDNLSVYHDDCFILRDVSKVIVLKEGDEIDLGSSQLLVMEIPGHDYSCLAFLFENNCFTGDAYIPGIKVFSKLQNGDKETATRSRERLERLEKIEKFNIYPGHIIN